MLKRVGFYETSEEVNNLTRSNAATDEQLIANYLSNGETLIATGSWADDLVDPHNTRICQYMVHTDGTWVWPSSLPYYVSRYHIELPTDFTQHMESRNWKPPTLDGEQLDNVVEQFMLEESIEPHGS
ncbi:hypothetical protein ACFZA1_32820 [Streptomyces filipinensis]|uniref:hypothetical protein n=1 Tax=Streptomyces filipinensis TaxID=66887 RepID=UPI0036E97153